MQFESAPLLIVIVGPTAVGKSELAIQVAAQMGGEIVSADSRLFYRGMDIGTAKPSQADRESIPHHLIDVANLDETWSLAVFQKAANIAIKDIWKRGKLPLLVGGTGQFIRAITEEWSLPEQAPDTKLREVLECWGRKIGPLELHHKISLIDPEAARLIEPMNLRRSVRALEVILRTGKLFSIQRQKKSSPYRVIQIGLTRPRSELYTRVDARIEMMINDGFLEEVKHLLAAGNKEDNPAFSGIGYREMINVINGRIYLAEAKLLIKRYTRQFIRRQSNWFKIDDPKITWFDLSEKSLDDVIEYIHGKIGSSFNEEIPDINGIKTASN